MSTHTDNLASNIAEAFVAGHSAQLYIGPESYQYTMAADRAKQLVPQVANRQDVQVDVVNWNRLCGFYKGRPGTIPPVDSTNDLRIALNLMIKSKWEIAQLAAKGQLPNNLQALPFDPARHVIFIVHEIDAVLHTPDHNDGNSSLTTLLRSYINAAMGSPVPTQKDSSGRDVADSSRGRRLLVFLGVDKDIGKYLPELNPVTVALPGHDASRQAIQEMLGPLYRRHQASKNDGLAALSEQETEAVVNALAGMPYQDRTEALGKAIVRHREMVQQEHRITDIATFCEAIEEEAARFVAGKAGLDYEPKNTLPAHTLPGYEAIDDYIESTVHLDPAWARAHALPAARGVLVIGAAGTGKTEFRERLARRVNRMLLKMSLGEIQGGVVGQSEMQMRSNLDFIRAKKPVVFVDEVDKSGANVIEGGFQGDGGVFSRMIGMLLTEMTDPRNEAIWIMAANRLVSVDGRVLLPAPLIRAGRMDERCYVNLPDTPIREAILRVHMEKHKITADRDARIAEIADMTDAWVGAELKDIIVRAVRRAGRLKATKIDTDWMRYYVERTVPLARNDAFKAELRANQQACEKFLQLGRSNDKPDAISAPVPKSRVKEHAPTRAEATITV